MSLFPDMMLPEKKDLMMKDEVNLATHPLCVFGKKDPGPVVHRELGPGYSIKLISNPKADSKIPKGIHLDFLYGLLLLLAEKTHYSFSTNQIMFYGSEAIKAAGKHPTKDHYHLLFETIHFYRWMGIESTELRVLVKGEVKQQVEIVSVIQNYSIVSGLKRGRKKSYTVDPSGYYKVIFTDWVMDNLRSVELSKRLNFSFMMSLSGPIVKKYFRMLDAWRYEGRSSSGEALELEREITHIADMLLLANRTYASEIRKTIDPIHNELIEKQYLHSVDYKNIGGKIIVFYKFSEFSIEQSIIYSELTSRGVNDSIAKRMALEGPLSHENIMTIVRYYDLMKKEKKVTAAYLYSILKSPDFEVINKFLNDHDRTENEERARRDKQKETKMLMTYQQHFEKKADDFLDSLSDDERQIVKAEALSRVKDRGVTRVTSRTYDLTVDIEMRAIAKERMQVPKFDEWLAIQNQKKSVAM